MMSFTQGEQNKGDPRFEEKPHPALPPSVCSFAPDILRATSPDPLFGGFPP